MKKSLQLVLILGLCLGAVFFLSACGKAGNTNQVSQHNQSEWTSLAKYLTDKGAKFYGAFWCSHCKNQKTMIGEAMQFITYIECAPNPDNLYERAQACIDANIESYPTWIFADNSRVSGVMSFEELANKVGYPIGPPSNAL